MVPDKNKQVVCYNAIISKCMRGKKKEAGKG